VGFTTLGRSASKMNEAVKAKVESFSPLWSADIKRSQIVECQLLRKGSLTPLDRGVTLSGMDHGKKKSFGSREAPKKGPPLGLVIALAAAGGMVIGSAGTYFFFKPPAAPKSSASPAAGGTPQAQTLTMPNVLPQKKFTPAPQPPGEAPPGKVWSVEHGHWHDALSR